MTLRHQRQKERQWQVGEGVLRWRLRDAAKSVSASAPHTIATNHQQPASHAARRLPATAARCGSRRRRKIAVAALLASLFGDHRFIATTIASTAITTPPANSIIIPAVCWSASAETCSARAGAR